MSDLTIRVAQPHDAEATRAIYNLAVTTSTATFDLVPRSLDEQTAWLVARGGAHVVLVAEDADRSIAGFASLSPYRDRPGYSTTVENSIYVAEDRQGQGVGRLLMTELIETARQHGFHTVVARIVGDHEASIALHRAVGYQEVGVEREVGRKFGRWLDVVVMQILL